MSRDPGHPTPPIMPGDWLRLRTLILLRWIAIGGQVAAILAAWRLAGVDLPLLPAFLVVGAAVLANLAAWLVFPQAKRLSETEATLTLLFDLAQLSALLFLTGGLSNPFALLILAPVTIAATALGTRAVVLLGLAGILLVSLVGAFHLPLRLKSGAAIRMPELIEFGFWLAIVIGVVFLGLYARRVAAEIRSMGEALLATQMALAREQTLTDLGGVVAAAAHELGTPLATIKLASSELIDELADRPDLRADAELIGQQADRCRDILRSMGRAGKDDLHLRSAPLSALLREAAEPHLERGRKVLLAVAPDQGAGPAEPHLERRPEIIHGLRNLIQNAVDFAAGTVWIDATWNAARLVVRIADDGPGFPLPLLGRMGEPFLRRRPPAQAAPGREGYEGMGLGLFIAKTLLERTGAAIAFGNGSDPFLSDSERPPRSGAVVEVTWPRDRIEVRPDAALGENRPIEG